MSKKLSVPQSGRVGNVINAITRYGQVEKQFNPPRNPRTPDQQEMRSNFGFVSRRWRVLTREQRIAWRISAADAYTISRLGRQVALNPYSYSCALISHALSSGWANSISRLPFQPSA
jgi:hypothetical protein